MWHTWKYNLDKLDRKTKKTKNYIFTAQIIIPQLIFKHLKLVSDCRDVSDKSRVEGIFSFSPFHFFLFMLKDGLKKLAGLWVSSELITTEQAHFYCPGSNHYLHTHTHAHPPAHIWLSIWKPLVTAQTHLNTQTVVFTDFWEDFGHVLPLLCVGVPFHCARRGDPKITSFVSARAMGSAQRGDASAHVRATNVCCPVGDKSSWHSLDQKPNKEFIQNTARVCVCMSEHTLRIDLCLRVTIIHFLLRQ